MLEVAAVQEVKSQYPGAEPDNITVAPGSIVFVSYYDAKNSPVNTLGFVLAVNSLDLEGVSEDGWPPLTITVPSKDASPALLATARWHEQFLRLTGVKHVSHGAHAEGGSTAAWQEIGATEGDFPELLELQDAPPANPTFTREGNTASLEVSLEQAAAVQSGKAPSGSVVSPLLNEPQDLEALEAQQKALAAQQDAVTKSIEAARVAREQAAAAEAHAATMNQGAGLDDTKKAVEAVEPVEEPAVEESSEPAVEGDEKKPDETQSS